MYPSSTPLVPDDQFHDHDFAPRDLDADRELNEQLAQQIKLIAVDLAIVRRSIGQVAANQDQFAAKQAQMSANLATLQQVEQDLRQQVLSPPAPKPAHPAVHNPPQALPR